MIEKKYKTVKREEKVAGKGFAETRTLKYRPEVREGPGGELENTESQSTKVLRREQVCV